MKTIQTILAAVDLSESSAEIIHRAAQLCRSHGARLEVLHVIEEAATAIHGDVLEATRRELAAAVEALSGTGLACDLEVETGKDFVAITRRARAIEADLIVIGAHGRHQLRDYLLGTTAEKLIRKASLPVLVVHRPPQGGYQRLLVPTDFSPASRQALMAASLIAPGASIDLLHVYGFWGEGRLSMAGADALALEDYRRQRESWAHESLSAWRQGIDLSGHQVEEHCHQGHAATVISEFAVIHGHDLVVMGTSGISGLPCILLGSVSEHVLRTIHCDTLTVRPPNFRFELP